jgi:hypothetical protein
MLEDNKHLQHLLTLLVNEDSLNASFEDKPV